MKFIVFSDSHGSAYQMSKILRAQRQTTSGVIHLGDGIEEFRTLSSLPGCERLLFFEVCGNGEQYSMAQPFRPPLVRVIEFEGVRILLTHGHAQSVSFGTERLAALARENGCRLALHGHTHIPSHHIEHGTSPEQADVEILCPGSISLPRAGAPSYGIIDLKEGQVLAYHVQI